MKFQRIITLLILCIAVFSLVATTAGIFSNEGPGPYEHTSVRGETVLIYGNGIYQHMSAEVAPQGIAQDVVTMFLGIPLLLIGLYLSQKGSLRGRILLAGTLGYFLVTYLFYLVMGMFNKMYLVYVILLSTSFFAFFLTILSFNIGNLSSSFNRKTPIRFVGGFLIFNTLAIALLWLQIVVPPLLKGAIPLEVEHYTTLIVQGLDLSILLPLAFLSGALLIKKRPLGYLMAPVYIVFLSILMTALTAKVIAMNGGLPVIIIIPLFNLLAILCSVLILKNINDQVHRDIGNSRWI
ncbi:MAG: hypothetical protein JM58_08850 [Peptococcaceae bacterium BICA1-8]|nr:MAG: hypothetical protein JM58_08850 [Peptococcaceae bacterium BICA1-8]